MAGTNAKVTPQFNASHKLFIDDFVSQIERKFKDNFEKGRKRKSKNIKIKRECLMSIGIDTL